MGPRLLLPCVLLSSAATAFAPWARATPNFPSVIADALQLASPPPCVTCHETNAGGLGTAIRPFAIFLQTRGLRPYDEASLRAALQAAEAEHHDSNGDGIDDVTALRRGLDPSAGAGDQPRYGCGATVASHRGRPSPWVLGALFAIVIVSRRQSAHFRLRARGPAPSDP
jgi:hypothetical protein